MDLEIPCFSAADLYLSFISLSLTASSKSCKTFKLNLRVYDCLFDDPPVLFICFNLDSASAVGNIIT